MDHIAKDVERARAQEEGKHPTRLTPFPPPRRLQAAVSPQGADEPEVEMVPLSRKHLESQRIIAHDGADPRSKSFDMLRTQVLQTMDAKRWQILAITSPTANCGKTLTAINLAFSIARQPDRSVLLVDLDLQKPQIASYLGVKCDKGLVHVLDGTTSLKEAVIHAGLGRQRLMLLPIEASTANTSEWMMSREMRALLGDLRKDYASCTVILDMPPVLATDDVIAILPQIDCLLLVLAVGTSTVSEIEQCSGHLQSTEVVRIVLNKVRQPTAAYY